MMVGDDIDEVRPGDPVARVMVWPVAEVDTRTSLGDAAEELAAEEVGAVAVMSSGRFAGLLSERDLVSHVAMGADLSHLTAGDVMTIEVVTARRTDSILEAARLMCEAGVRHLPVLDGQQVSGIVSMRDLMGVLVAHGSESVAVPVHEDRVGLVVPPPWAG
jgi:CBS domain-containing protein